jgi:hypothetical protein
VNTYIDLQITDFAEGEEVQFHSYLESLFKEAGNRRGGASSLQPEGGYSRVRRTLLTDSGAAPTCDGPTYSLCFSAVGDPYCCPQNADVSERRLDG